MRTGRSVLVGVGAGLALLAGGMPAGATMANLKAYKDAYPGKDPKAYTCKTCHNGAMGKKGDLNAYGVALQALALQPKAPVDAKKLTEADYRTIEKADADGDGASNLDEINAGTAPGDPTSTPAGASKTGSGK